jgi:hypothetical protein
MLKAFFIGLAFSAVSASFALAQTSFFRFGESLMRIEKSGSSVAIFYQQPREGLIEVGVRSGTLWFSGNLLGSKLSGEARIFSARCQTAVTYTMSGTWNSTDLIILTGQIPRLNDQCQIATRVSTTAELRLTDQTSRASGVQASDRNVVSGGGNPSLPDNFQALNSRWQELNSRCRGGSGDDPRTHEACQRRNAVEQQIKNLGYTYGCPGDAGYEAYWRSGCNSSQTLAVAENFNNSGVTVRQQPNYAQPNQNQAKPLSGGDFVALLLIIIAIPLTPYLIYCYLTESCPKCSTRNFRSSAQGRVIVGREHKYRTRKIYKKDMNGVTTFSHSVQEPYYEQSVNYELKCKSCGTNWTVSRKEAEN